MEDKQNSIEQSANWQDENELLRLIKINPIFINYIRRYSSESIYESKDFLLKAISVSNNVYPIIKAKEELMEDREFIKEAVKLNGEVLKYASEGLKKDEEIIFEAIKTDPYSIKYIDNELRYDYDFMLKAMTIEPLIIQFKLNEFDKNEEFILKAIELNPNVYNYINGELKAKKEIINAYNRKIGTPQKETIMQKIIKIPFIARLFNRDQKALPAPKQEITSESKEEAFKNELSGNGMYKGLEGKKMEEIDREEYLKIAKEEYKRKKNAKERE